MPPDNESLLVSAPSTSNTFTCREGDASLNDTIQLTRTRTGRAVVRPN